MFLPYFSYFHQSILQAIRQKNAKQMGIFVDVHKKGQAVWQRRGLRQHEKRFAQADRSGDAEIFSPAPPVPQPGKGELGRAWPSFFRLPAPVLPGMRNARAEGGTAKEC